MVNAYSIFNEIKKMIRNNYSTGNIQYKLYQLREADEYNFWSYRDQLLELASDLTERGKDRSDIISVL